MSSNSDVSQILMQYVVCEMFQQIQSKLIYRQPWNINTYIVKHYEKVWKCNKSRCFILFWQEMSVFVSVHAHSHTHQFNTLPVCLSANSWTFCPVNIMLSFPYPVHSELLLAMSNQIACLLIFLSISSWIIHHPQWKKTSHQPMIDFTQISVWSESRSRNKCFGNGTH